MFRYCLSRRIPKGFRPKAQGCEERATLGPRLAHAFNPERVAPLAFPRSESMGAGGHNPFRVEYFRADSPRVARSSQPWAGGHNPFGIEDVQSSRAASRKRSHALKHAAPDGAQKIL